MNPPSFPPLPDAPFVRAAGDSLHAEVEKHPNPDEVDHVWITMDIGIPERVVVSVNTLSKRNRVAGFDSRIRVGLVRGTWAQRPPRGAEVCPHFNYAGIEGASNVFYEHHDHREMESLLLSRCARACLMEVWGVPYKKPRLGLHQIHSRRASCAVAEDIVNRDGALKFYYEQDQATEMFLFKFCGQP